MNEPDLWSRLRRARLLRVLAVYLGASWVVLEVSDTLQDILELPEWTPAVAFILLLCGLLVIVATAWVQSSPSLESREAAGVVPDSWDVKVGDVARSLRAGRMPHLTWGRAVLGGAVMFSLLFGLSGMYVLHRSGGLPSDASPVAAEVAAAPGIAVLPFNVSGTDLELWREGMVDLLATNLDGVGALRGIDSRTVLARWSEAVPEGSRPRSGDHARRCTRGARTLGPRRQPALAGPFMAIAAAVIGVAGRPGEVARARSAVERRRSAALESGDSLEAERWRGLGLAIDGYAVWRGGDPQRALTSLETAKPLVVGWYGGSATRWWYAATVLHGWLGEINAELNRPAQAADHYRSLYVGLPVMRGLSYYRLAEMQERLGQHEAARRTYAEFIDVWQDADIEFQPIVEDARRRRAALVAERAS